MIRVMGEVWTMVVTMEAGGVGGMRVGALRRLGIRLGMERGLPLRFIMASGVRGTMIMSIGVGVGLSARKVTMGGKGDMDDNHDFCDCCCTETCQSYPF
jgi:hypothetical protein